MCTLQLVQRDAECKKLRELLWLNHGCGFLSLYGDDGEMQCNWCIIDFKRDSVNSIERRLQKRAREALK